MNSSPARACLQCGHSQPEGDFCEVCGSHTVAQGPAPGQMGSVPPTASGASAPPPPGAMPPPPPPSYSPPPIQQPQYGGPGYGGGYGAPPSGKGFFARLFDFSFETFIMPSIIKVLFIILLVCIGIGALFFVVTSFITSAAMGILTLIIIAPIGAFLYALFARVYLEIIVILFRIEENTSIIAESAKK